MRRLLFFFLTIVLMMSCFPVRTKDPQDAFEYWAGFKAPTEFGVVNGDYYKSPHFTYEFEVFLQLRPPKEWWIELVQQYQLSEDRRDWMRPGNAPGWFKPASTSIMYSRHDESDQSRFFHNPVTGDVFVYEAQY